MLKQVKELSERFGIDPGVFKRLGFMLRQETVFIADRKVMEFDQVKPIRRGIRFCRVFPHSVKPTTWAMQILGKHATRNCIDVTKEQAVELINGKQLKLNAAAENGFVIIRCSGHVVGVGHYKSPILKSQIPKYRPVE
ncbi:hypothetical protein CH330_02295 [candidate division WOR-3 bacterium JGI_Cruoil_03_51_56]|uniref:rRNA small subunit methyltransferase F RNA-binding PUA-like domain-containing protein n=1 Tax=candidate division WOR-3 bacterium JGI_Cruoil_03_51_56 TaxID=1973747 RepID=A0A235BWN4_UNCW3|nr:MAG: hypothetical protein CH330_02295 [candidate division WOR-3 bacterium JGI_Cruoil_03_51_56]